MLVKITILVFIATILYALGSGLFYLVRGKGESRRVVKALTWRICLSLTLFLLLMLAFILGWIQPHGI
jgi:hypothetical protein